MKMPSIANWSFSGDLCLNTSGVSGDNAPFNNALHGEKKEIQDPIALRPLRAFSDSL